jgi:hypothetical protein
MQRQESPTTARYLKVQFHNFNREEADGRGRRQGAQSGQARLENVVNQFSTHKELGIGIRT